MERSELSKLSERGVMELDAAWPQPEIMYEIRIERTVEGATPAAKLESYIDFLLGRLIPLVDDLRRRAGIRYWHFYNHEKVDLRVSIEDDTQMESVTAILAEHGVQYNPPTPMPVYDDQGFGSRLGCQALLRLFQAQSTFVFEVLQSARWLRGAGGGSAEVEEGIQTMVDALPSMSCHTQLNMFPTDPALKVQALLKEATSCMETLTSS